MHTPEFHSYHTAILLSDVDFVALNEDILDEVEIKPLLIGAMEVSY